MRTLWRNMSRHFKPSSLGQLDVVVTSMSTHAQEPGTARYPGDIYSEGTKDAVRLDTALAAYRTDLQSLIRPHSS